MVKIMKKEEKKFNLSLREMHKLADAGGQQYYNLLHCVMGQGKFCSSNENDFKEWAEKVLKKKLDN
jgi:hypothetical protein